MNDEAHTYYGQHTRGCQCPSCCDEPEARTLVTPQEVQGAMQQALRHVIFCLEEDNAYSDQLQLLRAVAVQLERNGKVIEGQKNLLDSYEDNQRRWQLERRDLLKQLERNAEVLAAAMAEISSADKAMPSPRDVPRDPVK